MSICYVTAFLDLERESWLTFSRKFDDYLKGFTPYIYMFEKCKDNPLFKMVCFIDEKRIEMVQKLNPPSNMILIKINEKYLNDHSVLWRRLNEETRIINSESYKNKVKHRLHFPENTNPRYTLINHSKIDFVNLAFDIVNSEYYCWVDFGYFSKEINIPTYMIDINKLNKNRINYTLINKIQDKDKDYMYTLTCAPEKIGGFFFFGDKQNLKQYQKLYHKVHDQFQKLEIVDDDQFMALQCYFENPSLFHLHYLGEWHKALSAFQKSSLTEIMNRNGSDKGSGHHNYTTYYETLFSPLRETKLDILEIGIGTNNPNIPSNMSGTPGGYKPGSSLRGWKEYFSLARVHGCDIDRNILFQEDRIETFFLNQTDKQSLQEQIVFKNQEYDIIIDDGLHFFPVNWFVAKEIICKLRKNGYYIIEDIKDFDKNVLKEPFWKLYKAEYIEIPNPKNKTDNNILIIKKSKINGD